MAYKFSPEDHTLLANCGFAKVWCREYEAGLKDMNAALEKTGNDVVTSRMIALTKKFQSGEIPHPETLEELDLMEIKEN